MAGKSRPQVFGMPTWRQALRAKFLDFGFRHNPDALRLLATQVKNGLMTPRAWVDSFDLGDTWVEEWVNDTLAYWKDRPDSCPDFPEPQTNGQPAVLSYPPPRVAQNAEDVFEFSVRGVPVSKLSLG